MIDRLDPEQNRPEGLPTNAAQVQCLRCGRYFEVGAMRWDHRRGLWVCAYWPDCEGAGFHCDLHDARAEHGETSNDSPRSTDEQLISLVDACGLLPRRRGKKIHYSTVYRWATKGARGQKLETILLGGVRYTTREALRRFERKGPAQQESPSLSSALREHLYGEKRQQPMP